MNGLKKILFASIFLILLLVPKNVYAFTNGYFDKHKINTDYTIPYFYAYQVSDAHKLIFDNDNSTTAYITPSYGFTINFNSPVLFEYISCLLDPTHGGMSDIYIQDDSGVGVWYKAPTGKVRLDSLDPKFKTKKVASIRIQPNTYWNEFDLYEPVPAPSILSVTPANGRTDVSIYDGVIITFDSNVIDSGTVQLDGVQTTKIVSGSTIKLTPVVPLSFDTNYSITVKDVENVNGGIMRSVFTSNFRTAKDTSPLNVVYIKPPPGSVNIPLNQQIEIKFNKPIDLNSISNVRVQNGNTIEPTTSNVLGDILSLTFNNLPLQMNTTYKIYIEGVKDSIGNTLSAPVIVDFTTTFQSNQLNLISYRPPSGVVPYGQQFEFEFDKNVDPSSVVYEFKDSNGNVIPATVNVIGTKVVIVPSLQYGMTYDFTFIEAKSTSGVQSPINLKLTFSVMKTSNNSTFDKIVAIILDFIGWLKKGFVDISLIAIPAIAIFLMGMWLWNKLRYWLFEGPYIKRDRERWEREMKDEKY